uniref:Uncharacterized protein n=1 Tax=Romanomermis culicivorax TaxID=13658 RepID=A0A915JJ57_ROMCU
MPSYTWQPSKQIRNEERKMTLKSACSVYDIVIMLIFIEENLFVNIDRSCPVSRVRLGISEREFKASKLEKLCLSAFRSTFPFGCRRIL